MIRQRALLSVIIATAFLCLVAMFYHDRAATSAAEPKATAVAEMDSVAAQVKELQKQVAELQTRMNELQKSRIVAAGTATWTRPDFQANKTNSRVKLPADVAAQLGKDCIVLLTSHFPKGGFPYFAAYWKVAPDGFDITLVDPPLNDGTTGAYSNPNKTYLIDWIVVKK